MASRTLTIGIDARIAAVVPAGRGRYLREVLRRLPALLDDDHQLALYAQQPWVDLPESSLLHWRLVNPGALPWPVAAGFAMRDEVDVVLATSSYLLTAVAPAPVYSMVWDMAPFHSEFHPPRGSGFERVTLPIAVRRCAGLVAISAATRDELAGRHPRVLTRTVVAHPAAGPQFSPGIGAGDEQALARLGVRRPYVLATGTVEPRKNLPRLIAAFASLPEQVRDRSRLVLAGAPGWDTQDTFAHAAEYAELVDTIGFVPDADLPALYRGADLFCYPSLYEGFGIPVLEAMACGIPVVTSGTSSMPEVGGDAAVYVDPRDERDIARVLGELLGDPARRAALAAAGPTRAASFSWDAAARVVLSTLLSHTG